jgi:oxygen tolerance protein BatD
VKAYFFAPFLVVMSLAPAAAQPRVRVEIDAKDPILVGQQIRVNVTVLAPNFFLSSPQFPTFDIAGAVVTLLDENALNSTETIDGEMYAGIRKSYAITPRRAGTFTLPPIQITFRYAAEPGKPGVDGAVTLPPQTFTARLTEGAQATAAPALVAKVVVTQTLDGDPGAMKVGDALTRTVETFAANTQAMMIPPPTFEAPAGVRIYPRDPVVADVTTDRGNFTGGRRVDQVTYVFEEPGTNTLPAIEIAWFNADSGKQQVSTAPAINVSVAPPPRARTDIPPPASPSDATAESATRTIWQRALPWSLGLVAVALAGLWGLRRFGPRVRAWRHARRQAWQASEPASFARLKRACLTGDAAAAYRELGIWAGCAGFSTAQALSERDPALRSQVTKLERHLYGSAPAPWSGPALFNAAATARASRLAAHGRHRPSALPALNPGVCQTIPSLETQANPGDK